MALKGKQLSAKLFLEGMEVPLIGATVTFTVGQASIAYIDIVPHQTINNILPRTMVHLMVRDFNNPAGGYPYVLMFEGEVFGFSFAKTPSSRSMTISCIDDSSYWDNVLTYYFNAQQSLGKGADSVAATGQELADAHAQQVNVFAVTHSTTSFFLQIVGSILKDATKDFLDGLIAVYKQITNINDFYNNAENRLRIIDRILLHSSGALNTLLQADQALEWFEGILGRQTGFTSLRGVIQDLMTLIFHDFVSVPFPGRVPNTSMTGTPLPSTDGVNRTIGEFIFKPNLYMVPPPTCNIFFPDEYSSFNYSRNFFQEPSRLIYQPEMPEAFTASETIALPHTYQPESFNNFMLETTPAVLGTDALSVDQDFGHFADPDTNVLSQQTNQGKKREQQFLTNEEKMKGIFMVQEQMVPATSQFRAALPDAGRAAFAKNVAKYLFFKKRFQERQIQITSHLKPSVVPGFTTLVLDASDAGQTIIAYCSSVTHRVYATQGGYTNTTLSYARTVGEEDIASGADGSPPIPPWFSAELFGTEPTTADKEPSFPAALSTFFASLLGSKGSDSICDYTNEDTLTGAAAELLSQYNTEKAKANPDIPSLIASITSRDYVKMVDAFGFIGATTQTTTANLSNAFVTFTGARISGGTTASPTADSAQIKARRAVITAYRKALMASRGYRG